MAEKAFSIWWKEHAPGFWRGLQHKFEDGWPDLVGVLLGLTVFVELKYCSRWPVKPGSPLDPWESDDKRRQAQAIWLWKWWEKGGYSYLAVKVRDELFFLQGAQALEAARGQTQEWWRNNAINATGNAWEVFKGLICIRQAALTVLLAETGKHP